MKHSSDPVLHFVLATTTSFVMRGLPKVWFQFFYCFSFSKTLEQVTQWLVIKCTVIFLSTFLADEFREDADIWRVLVRYKGLEPYSLFLSGKIKCTLCCSSFATRNEKTKEIPGHCFEQQVLGCCVFPKQMFQLQKKHAHTPSLEKFKSVYLNTWSYFINTKTTWELIVKDAVNSLGHIIYVWWQIFLKASEIIFLHDFFNAEVSMVAKIL